MPAPTIATSYTSPDSTALDVNARAIITPRLILCIYTSVHSANAAGCVWLAALLFLVVLASTSTSQVNTVGVGKEHRCLRTATFSTEFKCVNVTDYQPGQSTCAGLYSTTAIKITAATTSATHGPVRRASRSYYH